MNSLVARCVSLPLLLSSRRFCSVLQNTNEATVVCSRGRKIFYPDEEKPVILTPEVRDEFDFGVLRNCVVPVNKPIVSLAFDLISDMRQAMGARHYKIGHSGVVDVMESGLMLLLFGRATRQADDYKEQEKQYKGQFRIGQETKTFDALTPVYKSHPWQHISDEDVDCEVNSLTKTRLQVTQPEYIPTITNKDLLCHLKRRSETEKRLKRMEILHFKARRKTAKSSEFDFEVVCKGTSSVSCLIHELGKRLQCGAHVRYSERLRIGQFMLTEHAWDPKDLSQYLTHLRQQAYLKDYQMYDEIRHQFWRRLGPVSKKKRRRLRLKRKQNDKMQRLIRQGKKEPIMTALCY